MTRLPTALLAGYKLTLLVDLPPDKSRIHFGHSLGLEEISVGFYYNASRGFKERSLEKCYAYMQLRLLTVSIEFVKVICTKIFLFSIEN